MVSISAPSAEQPGERNARNPAIDKSTYVYKTVDDLELKLDVFGRPAERAAPVLMWIHGGALMIGARADIDLALAAKLAEAGCTVASIDYRLAPETKLPEIVQDVTDAYDWIRERGPEFFNAAPDRIAVAGASAGGYLALMTGLVCRPRPQVLAALYGYGDIVGDWYTTPCEHYRATLPLVSEEDARLVVGGSPVVSGTPEQRGKLYLHCRQQGTWPTYVLEKDPTVEPEAFVPFCPAKNVSADYPPTVLIHGDIDHDVPYEQSRLMARALAKAGVAHQCLTIANADRGFAGGDPRDVAEAMDRAAAFVIERLAARK